MRSHSCLTDKPEIEISLTCKVQHIETWDDRMPGIYVFIELNSSRFKVATEMWRILSSVSGFKNVCELVNLAARKFSKLYKNHVCQCMAKIFCVEFQRVPLKFHTKYLTIHVLRSRNLGRRHICYGNLSNNNIAAPIDEHEHRGLQMYSWREHFHLS